MIKSSLGPRNEKKAKELIDEYNSLSVGDSLYTSNNLGRYLDYYFREHGLSYGDDFMCPPFREGEIVKLTDKKVVSSRQIQSSITKDEYFNMIKKHKSTNASTPEFRKQELDAIAAFPVGTKFAFKEDNSWHDVNTVYEKIDNNVWKITQVINGEVNDEYTKSDNEVRIYISDEFGGNAYPTSYVSGYGSINSSRRNNMIKSSRYDEPLLHKENSINTQYIKSQLLGIASKYFPNLIQDRNFKNHIHLDEHNMLDYSCEKRSDYSQGFGEYFVQIYDFSNRTSKVSWVGYGKENFNRDLPDIEEMIKSISGSSRQIKSSIITPWDTNQVTGTSDEDLGLSAVVDIYGNEFVNVDENTLNELKDTLIRYFDDEAYVRDWNINNPDYQIEDAFEVTDPEEMNVEDLARYFDYEAYGRDIRLEDNMVWDSENEYWVSAHDVDDEELNNDKYIFMRG